MKIYVLGKAVCEHSIDAVEMSAFKTEQGAVRAMMRDFNQFKKEKGIPDHCTAVGRYSRKRNGKFVEMKYPFTAYACTVDGDCEARWEIKKIDI